MTGADLLIHNVEIEGAPHLDLRVRDGVVVEIGANLRRREDTIDGAGGAVIPGLIDHHIHLLASAAGAGSLDVGPDVAGDRDALVRCLRAADASAAPGAWLRGVGYVEQSAGPLTRERLDAWLPHRPLRIQYATGSLWALNSAALTAVTGDCDIPDCAERDEAGRLTGRIWRGDAWLKSRIGTQAPDLSTLGAGLCRAGVTGVCDASATTDAQTAALLAGAVRSGALPQRIMLMSARALDPPLDCAFAVGPVKILLDEADLPDLEEIVARIRQARAWRRPVAFHAVTAVELAFAMAAFEDAGAVSGDRIEHGGVVSAAAAARIAQLGLTVVTQPGFIAERGDRYLRDVAEEDIAALYPCASLLGAGVRVAGSTDAPYTKGDVWSAIAAAVSRRTPAGRVLGNVERLPPRRALDLFLGPLADPGGRPRRVEIGAPADLCVLGAPIDETLREPGAERVLATVIGGRVVYARGRGVFDRDAA